jgi:hypothetical protein
MDFLGWRSAPGQLAWIHTLGSQIDRIYSVRFRPGLWEGGTLSSQCLAKDRHTWRQAAGRPKSNKRMNPTAGYFIEEALFSAPRPSSTGRAGGRHGRTASVRVCSKGGCTGIYTGPAHSSGGPLQRMGEELEIRRAVNVARGGVPLASTLHDPLRPRGLLLPRAGHYRRDFHADALAGSGAWLSSPSASGNLCSDWNAPHPGDRICLIP